MSPVFVLAAKDLRLLLRDRFGLFFVIAFPILMGVAFGLIGASFGGSDHGSWRVAVIDDDGGALAAKFRAALAAHDALEVRSLPFDRARDLVRKGKLLGLVRIPAGFSDSAGMPWVRGPALEVGLDPSRAAEGGMLQGYLMQAMGTLVQDRFSHPGSMRKAMQRSLGDLARDPSLGAPARDRLRQILETVDGFLGRMDDLTSSGGAGPTLPAMELARIEKLDITASPGSGKVTARLRSGWDISFPSAILWGLLGCMAGFAISIARERSAGTFYRLCVAPIRRTHILLGKGLACFLAGLGVCAAMMGLGLALGIQLNSPLLLVVAALCTAFCFTGLMMAMSVLSRSEQGVAGAGWGIIITMALCGGGMMPLAFMPAFMRQISNLSPVKWGILALEGAIWRGFTAADMVLPCSLLLAIGLGGFLLGARVLARADT